MSFLDIFNPPAANVQSPQFMSAQQFGAVAPTPFGYTPPPQATTYMPGGFGAADTGMLGGIGGLSQYNMFGNYLPAAQGIAGSMINSPFASTYQLGAGPAGAMGMGAGLNAYGAGGNLYGLGGSIANTAFDPQQALYERTLGQVRDQTLAGLSNAGLATTPYGAGVLGNTLGNFNIDWQNQQLQRQIAGGQAAGGLYGQAAGLQAGAPGTFMGGAGLPWQTGQTIGGANLGTLGTLGQFGQGAAVIPGQQIGGYQNYLSTMYPYLSLANQAPLSAYTAGLGGQQQAFQQAQTAGFQDPYALATMQNKQASDLAKFQLDQATEASKEQGQMFSGLGAMGKWAFPGGLGTLGAGASGGSLLGSLGALGAWI